MKGLNQIWEKDGYTLRPIRPEDGDAYWEQGFGVDAEVDRLTGSRSDFTREEVMAHFQRCLTAENRADFLIIGPDGRILGESVINEIDREARCANFRIALFRSDSCGKGIGSWAVRLTRDYAFETLGLHRLELDVFSFNPRAVRAYEKAGFRREGVRREAVPDGAGYGDDILMAILEDEWRELKKAERPPQDRGPKPVVGRAGGKTLAQAALLADELFPGHAPGELLAEWEALSPSECAVFLATQDGAPVGFAQCQLRRDYVEGTETSPVGYLEAIYVRTGFRRRGAATALLSACEDWARARGCVEFASDCELGNTDSAAFHLAAGFAEANRIVCFTKRLRGGRYNGDRDL